MPKLKTGSTLRRDLGFAAYEYMMQASQRGFIGLQILPIFDVVDQTANYPVITLESMLKLPDTIQRAPRGNYARDDYEIETGTYQCVEYGQEALLDDVERALYNDYYEPEEFAVQRAVDKILRMQEKRIAGKVFNTANITQTSGVNVEWSTAATCTPRVDVMTAVESMRTSSGIEPNVMAISIKVFRNLLRAAEVTGALKYTNPIELGSFEAQRRILSQYFGLELVVGNAIYDSAKKGKAYSIADIWDDEYCGLFKVAGTRDIQEPSLGRTFLWTEDSPENVVTEQYREEQKRSDVFRARHYVDERFIFTGAGYLLSNITA